jgi:hypothetical protein
VLFDGLKLEPWLVALGGRASEVVIGIAEEIAAQHVIHLPTAMDGKSWSDTTCKIHSHLLGINHVFMMHFGHPLREVRARQSHLISRRSSGEWLPGGRSRGMSGSAFREDYL